MSATHPPVVPATMAHQIPFRQPALTVPLNWSFAGSGPTPLAQNHQLSNLMARKDQPSIPSSLSRKRSAPDEFIPNDPNPALHPKSISGLPKRTKKSTPTAFPSAQSSHPAFQSGLDPKNDEIDFGAALISLTKNEIVNLLHGLIQQKPELKPTIKSLLPPPSLESVLMKLAEVEKQLIESVPSKRTNREEYIWNRVRVPLTSYVNDCLSCLEISSNTTERRSGSQDGKVELSEIYGAVSDQLTLLSQLSLSISRVESSLPRLSTQPSNEDPNQDLNWNVSYPFQSVLIPSLFQNWKRFIEMIHKLIFVDRMILSEALIRKWFHLLNELSSLNHNQFLSPNGVPDTTYLGDNHTVQRLMIAIRDEAQNRFGCLVGLKK